MKQEYRIIIVILILSLLTTNSISQDLANIPGMFLDIGYGARPMGMGGAFTALANDANAALWNPAGLLNLPGQCASFFYTRQLNLIPYTLAVYANKPAGKKFAHSEALIVSGDDALRETLLLIGAAYDLDTIIRNLHVGATFRYKSANFGENSDGGQGRVTGSAIGLSIDLGAIYPLQENFLAAVTLKNFLDVVAWNTSASGSYNQGSPTRLVTGLAFVPIPACAIALDWEKSLHRDTKDRIHVGVERQFLSLITLRTGAFQNLTVASETDYSLGIGFQYRAESLAQFNIDAAYVLQEFDPSLKISLSVYFY